MFRILKIEAKTYDRLLIKGTWSPPSRASGSDTEVAEGTEAESEATLEDTSLPDGVAEVPSTSGRLEDGVGVTSSDADESAADTDTESLADTDDGSEPSTGDATGDVAWDTDAELELDGVPVGVI